MCTNPDARFPVSSIAGGTRSVLKGAHWGLSVQRFYWNHSLPKTVALVSVHTDRKHNVQGQSIFSDTGPHLGWGDIVPKNSGSFCSAIWADPSREPVKDDTLVTDICAPAVHLAWAWGLPGLHLYCPAFKICGCEWELLCTVALHLNTGFQKLLCFREFCAGVLQTSVYADGSALSLPNQGAIKISHD